MNENSDFKKKIDYCYARGYDITKFLTDNHIANPVVYIDMDVYPEVELFVVSLRLIDEGKTRFCSDDNVGLMTVLDCRMGKDFKAVKYTDVLLSEKDTVLALTSNPQKPALQHFRAAKVSRIWDTHYILVKMINECCYNAYYRELREVHPNVTFVNLTLPSFPAKNRNEYEQYVVDHGYTFRDFQSDLVAGEIPECGADIVEGLTPKDAIDTLEVWREYINRGCLDIEDVQSDVINISNGDRITTGNPEQYEKTVYLFGPCVFFGIGASDDKTIASIIQRKFNHSGKSIRVINKGRCISGRFPQIVQNIKLTDFDEGDIVCLYGNFTNKDAQYNIDVTNLFNRPHNYGNVFIDPSHLSMRGMEIVAEKIYEGLVDVLNEHTSPQAKEKLLQRNHLKKKSRLSFEEEEQLSEYLKAIASFAPIHPVGSIVMNCNPFTLGHRYLIEQSAAKVERLFVFVVEEDKSIFPFADRIELVRKGTADLPNVVVLPSGKFIISSLTFIDYFGKSELQDQVIDPSMDVEIFGQYIAPTLGITVRFAGEEPLDNVTRQYNDAMARILPQYGVAFEVIPRKRLEGEVISASRVRKLLEEKDFDAIAGMVPETTWEYVKQGTYNAPD